MAQSRMGTGFSLWHDLEDEVHVDFFGFEDAGEIERLRALVVELHASLKIEAGRRVDFFGEEAEAFGAMVTFFEKGEEV